MAERPTLPDPVTTFLLQRKRLIDGLDDGARSACAQFIRSKRCDDGGYAGPGGRSDVYYTFFALAGLTLLGESVENAPIKEYLAEFGDGADLDVVHLCCLIRCRNLVAMHEVGTWATGRIGRMLQARRVAGTVNELKQKATRLERVYDLYLAAQTGRELGMVAVAESSVDAALVASRRDDGGYAHPLATAGTTTVTAAAMWLNLFIGREVTGRWFDSVQAPMGGFKATPQSEEPDLLSTSAAIQARRWAGDDFKDTATRHVAFIESCWLDDGSFVAHPRCRPGDVEYLVYGLSALANLLD